MVFLFPYILILPQFLLLATWSFEKTPQKNTTQFLPLDPKTHGKILKVFHPQNTVTVPMVGWKGGWFQFSIRCHFLGKKTTDRSDWGGASTPFANLALYVALTKILSVRKRTLVVHWWGGDWEDIKKMEGWTWGKWMGWVMFDVFFFFFGTIPVIEMVLLDDLVC